MNFRASVIGANGYAGGELCRLLLTHPSVDLVQATSRSLAGKPIHAAHPNLRGHTPLTLTAPDELEPCDVLFLCMPHGESSKHLARFIEHARVVIDLAADFRLRDPEEYRKWYGGVHPLPDAARAAVYGLPEVARAQIPDARLISGVGCNATAMTLALLPLARAGLIDRAICDIKVGSSEGGREASASSHHPERSRAVRTYSTSGHRHLAEVQQSLSGLQSNDQPLRIDATITAIEMVRGVLCTAHVLPTRPVDDKELWRLYRDAYAQEPFVRIVRDRAGLHRLPDPKVLAGSNHADVGFAVDDHSGRIIALCAIDNMMKGAAGSALQSMNLALGLPETAGLTFPGLHPI